MNYETKSEYIKEVSNWPQISLNTNNDNSCCFGCGPKQPHRVKAKVSNRWENRQDRIHSRRTISGLVRLLARWDYRLYSR